ncbi:MAG: sigma-70 family RNA polymerase sigma factor [Planctomycetia bacterium]|nr:sigma-70 family RNA polymerase sigma factor [Planctomycetia bacterium]
MANPEPLEPVPQSDPPREEVSDRSLLRRLQHGQADASTELYLRYAERLRKLAASQSSPDLAQRFEPEDIVQSVFRTFFRRAGLGQYTVPDGEEIWKLLLVIGLNKVRATGAFHRAAKRDVRRTSGGESFDRAIESEPGQNEDALNDLRLVIEELLVGLPEAHRRMIELRIEGHEVTGIATAVQRSKRTVERVLQEFCRRLDAQIHDEDR